MESYRCSTRHSHSIAAPGSLHSIRTVHAIQASTANSQHGQCSCFCYKYNEYFLLENHEDFLEYCTTSASEPFGANSSNFRKRSVTSDGGAFLFFGAGSTMPEEAVAGCRGGAELLAGESGASCGASTADGSIAETAALRFVFDDESEPVAAASAAARGLLLLFGSVFSGESGVAAVITVSGSGATDAGTAAAADVDGTRISIQYSTIPYNYVLLPVQVRLETSKQSSAHSFGNMFVTLSSSQFQNKR